MLQYIDYIQIVTNILMVKDHITNSTRVITKEDADKALDEIRNIIITAHPEFATQDKEVAKFYEETTFGQFLGRP